MGQARSLTDKPITREIVEEDGRVVAAHLSDVVTDPESADAVQVPDGDVYPTANATQLDPLAVHETPDPADALDDDEASVNEIQSVTLDDTADGTFTLTFEGDETDDIDYDATAAAVKTALVALPSIGTDGEGHDNVTVSGSAGGPWTVTFVNDLGGRDVAALTGDEGDLVAVTPTAEVETTVEGAA